VRTRTLQDSPAGGRAVGYVKRARFVSRRASLCASRAGVLLEAGIDRMATARAQRSSCASVFGVRVGYGLVFVPHVGA